ncbi:MAG TPA: sigma-70 family RNA polymerase sigma factor [Gemmatimonadales bacterium]|nr:sigma-70 family RNA polymerase sigma factor [Gemmatimonadales bacterium]
MGRDPRRLQAVESKVVSLAEHARGAVETELMRIFDEKQGLLLQYLTHRLGEASDAQDAAQLSFMRLWEQRTKLRGSNLTALLFVTARNLATDILRSRRSGRLALLRSEDGAAADLRDEAPSTEQVVIARSELALVRKLIGELPPRCRRAFEAYQLDGLDYRTIADRMGVTESMVRKYVRRALAHCASRYAELDGWK